MGDIWLYWMIAGSVIVLISWLKGFEYSISYFLTAPLVWGLFVGLPSYMIREAVAWYEKRKIEKSAEEEDQEQQDEL